MALLRRPAAADSDLLALFEESGLNIQRTTLMLRDLLVDYPEHATLVDGVQDCEHRGDRIARDIIHRLSATGDGGLPFSAADGHALAIALDDIVDHAEHTADALGVYGVEAPMEQAVALAEILVAAATQVAAALAALGADSATGILDHALREISRLESEGDRRLREALAALFANGIDPMVVIRWKDIYESLESAIDACQKVAHLVEGIALKRGRR